MENPAFVTLTSYSDHIVADITIAALHHAGIETFILKESHSMFPAENTEIKVKESDLEKAQAVLATLTV